MTAVLVVDHSASDREPIVTVLGYQGYTVLEAANREQALRLARSERPDVIVADILMPTMDGYTLVRDLRTDEATADIRVIFYTASYVLDEVRRLAVALGVSHILTKPPIPEEVLRVVGEAESLRPDQVTPIPSEGFRRDHLRLLNARLLEKVEELRETVILAGSLQWEASGPESDAAWPLVPTHTQFDSLLSPRELEVLSMIVEGATDGEIADRLVIATSTVQSHVKHILKKLGVKNRTEAAVRYVRR